MAGVSNVDTNLTVAQPNQMSLGDLMSMARGAQAYQQAGELNPLLIQEAQQKIRSATAEANVAEETQAPKISKAKTEAESALVGLSKDQLANMWNHTTGVIQQLQLMKNDPKLSIDSIVGKAKEINDNMNGDDKSLKQSLLGLPQGENGNPPSKTELQSWLAQKEASMLATQAHIEKIYPAPTFQDVGGGYQPVSGANPLLTGVAAGTSQGEFVVKGPGPTQEYSAQPGDKTGFTEGSKYIVVNGVPKLTGQGPLNTNQQLEVQKDLAETNTKAQGAQTRIGLYQGLKDLSRTALVGPAADKRTMAIKIGSLFGVQLDPKTVQSMNDSDLFQKEAAMLGQLPGGTDAANLVNQMANPNFKMMPEAIREAGDLGIAREKLNLLGQKIKGQYRLDANGYYNAMQNFNQLSDPRAYNFLDDKQNQQRVMQSLGLDNKGNPLPKNKSGLTDAQEEFKDKVEKLYKLRKQFEQ